jgi:hypothetical protein
LNLPRQVHRVWQQSNDAGTLPPGELIRLEQRLFQLDSDFAEFRASLPKIDLLTRLSQDVSGNATLSPSADRFLSETWTDDGFTRFEKLLAKIDREVQDFRATYP